jgi:hypothetical protein
MSKINGRQHRGLHNGRAQEGPKPLVPDVPLRYLQLGGRNFPYAAVRTMAVAGPQRIEMVIDDCPAIHPNPAVSVDTG